MKVKCRYVSKSIPPYAKFLDNLMVAAGQSRLDATVINPSTGRPFGMTLIDDGGELVFYGPPFVFHTIAHFVRVSNGEMKDTYFHMYNLQDAVNERYLTRG